jgi:hypothetical protein
MGKRVGSIRFASKLPVSCVVEKLFATGARLTVPDATAIPPEFVLVFEYAKRQRRARACRVFCIVGQTISVSYIDRPKKCGPPKERRKSEGLGRPEAT